MNCIILPTRFGFESVEFSRNTVKCSVTWRLFGLYESRRILATSKFKTQTYFSSNRRKQKSLHPNPFYSPHMTPHYNKYNNEQIRRKIMFLVFCRLLTRVSLESRKAISLFYYIVCIPYLVCESCS